MECVLPKTILCIRIRVARCSSDIDATRWTCMVHPQQPSSEADILQIVITAGFVEQDTCCRITTVVRGSSLMQKQTTAGGKNEGNAG